MCVSRASLAETYQMEDSEIAKGPEDVIMRRENEKKTFRVLRLGVFVGIFSDLVE
jgi:hypothetical protein